MKMTGARPDTWMPFYVGDYLGDTMHLTTEQHGAYVLLILACWKRGGFLPNDETQLAATARLTVKRWREIRSVILAFFLIADSTLTHKRITKEILKAANVTEKRSKAGGRGAAKRWQTDGRAINPRWQNDGQSQSQSPLKENLEGLARAALQKLPSSDPDFGDPAARKAAWETRIINELRRTLPDARAMALIDAYLAGDLEAKAAFERVDKDIKSRRAA